MGREREEGEREGKGLPASHTILGPAWHAGTFSESSTSQVVYQDHRAKVNVTGAKKLSS